MTAFLKDDFSRSAPLLNGSGGEWKGSLASGSAQTAPAILVGGRMAGRATALLAVAAAVPVLTAQQADIGADIARLKADASERARRELIDSIPTRLREELEREEARMRANAEFFASVAHIPADDPRSRIHSFGAGPFFWPQGYADAWTKLFGPLPENVKVHGRDRSGKTITKSSRQLQALMDFPELFVHIAEPVALKAEPPKRRGAQWKHERNPYGRRR